MIRWDKPLQSAAGNSARYIGEILSTNKNNRAVAVTYVKDDTKWESVFVVDENGYGTGPGGSRIVIQNITKSGWVAVLRDSRIVLMFESQEEAKRAYPEAIDWVKIHWVE